MTTHGMAMGDDLMLKVAARQRRVARGTVFLGLLCDHLDDPVTHSYPVVLAHALEIDAMQGGLGPWAEWLLSLADDLVAGDAAAWERAVTLLVAGEGIDLSRGEGLRFKNRSPYVGKALLVLEESMGFSQVKGEASALLRGLIEDAGLRVHPGGRYLVSLDVEGLGDAKVSQVRKGFAVAND